MESEPARDPMVETMRRRGWISVVEASRRGLIPKQTLYSWIRAGTLPVQRVGRRKVFVSLTALRTLSPVMQKE